MKNKLLIINILILITFLMYKPINNKYIAYKDRVYSYNHTYNIKWIDNNNINGKRPQEITISLYNYVNDTKIAEQTLQVTGDSSFTFENISDEYVKITVNRVDNYKVMLGNENTLFFKYISNDSSEYPTRLAGLNFSIEDENNNFLKGIEFKLKSYNEEYIGDLIEEETYYYMPYEIYKFIDINNLLSKSQISTIKNISTVKDLQRMYNEEVIYNYLNIYGEFVDTHIILLPTLYKLEETRIPNGYVKSKYLIPGTIALRYQVKKNDLIETNYDDYKIELSDIDINVFGDSGYFEYDDYIESDYLGTDIKKTHELWRSNARKKGCTDIPNIFEPKRRENNVTEELNQHTNSTEYGDGNNECPILLKADKGEISLSVDNKVNETKSLTTTTNTTLTYSVTIKNTGNIDAIDNTLTSKIPEGFKYVEGSASDGGVFNNGEIEWKVARVNSGAEKTYTFKVLVPKGTNITKDYIGESSVTSYSMQNRVNSDKTVVKLSLINPNTVTPITIIALVGISLIILIVLIINFYNNKEENKLYDNF